MISPQLSSIQTQAIDALAEKYVSRPYVLDPIGGGRNSRVYRLSGLRAPAYVLKIYFRHADDPRDRLGTEFGSYTFLWQNGIREIPQPIENCQEAGIAVYEYINGERIPTGGVGEADIDAALQFVARLQALRTSDEARSLNPASEAYFSVDGIYENIRRRLDRLVEGQLEQSEISLESFLQEEFLPTFQRVTQAGRTQLDWQQELPFEQRALSPSDFGFHNALRRGNIVFVDFEYFGWDDPAKLISDFILHPAMELDEGLAQRFADGVYRHFDEALKIRMRTVYPLFGLKWCLICLNQFLPEHRLRREFAAGGPAAWEQIGAQQLAKARRILSKVNQSEHFPYVR